VSFGVKAGLAENIIGAAVGPTTTIGQLLRDLVTSAKRLVSVEK